MKSGLYWETLTKSEKLEQIIVAGWYGQEENVWIEAD